MKKQKTVLLVNKNYVRNKTCHTTISFPPDHQTHLAPPTHPRKDKNAHSPLRHGKRGEN